MKKRILSCIIYLLTIGWMMLIFFFSSQNGVSSSKLSMKIVEVPRAIFYPEYSTYSLERQQEITSNLSFLVRKGAHMSEYAILCLFVYLSVRTIARRFEPYFIAIGFCFLYALSDEFHQGFISGRTMAFVDVLIDVSGALIMMIFILLLHIIRKEKNNV